MMRGKRKNTWTFDAFAELVCIQVLVSEYLWGPLQRKFCNNCQWWKKDGKNGTPDGFTDEKSEDSGSFSSTSSITILQQGQTQQCSSNQYEQKFICILCGNRFSNPSNKRRHYLSIHGENLCDILDCPLTFEDKKDLDNHREEPHTCQYCGKLFKGETSLGPARKHLNEHVESNSNMEEYVFSPHLSSTRIDDHNAEDLDDYPGDHNHSRENPFSVEKSAGSARRNLHEPAESNSNMEEPVFSPHLSSTRIDDHNTCCTEPHKTHEIMLELPINTEEKNGITLMALVFSFLFGPENIYSSTEHMDDIVDYGRLTSSCCRHRGDNPTNFDLPSTITLDSDPSVTRSVFINPIKCTEAHGGAFDRASLESAFQQLCDLGNYGIFTINQVPVAVVLTNDKFYAFNFHSIEVGATFRLQACMPSHPRSDCLQEFLYEYFQSVGHQTESSSSFSSSSSGDFLKYSFSSKIFSLKSLSRQVLACPISISS